MPLIHYTTCPVCNSAAIHQLLTVKDFSVSGDDFAIWQCDNCMLRFTQDVPDENSIGPYYASPDYISHSNTDKGLLNKLYQKVRNYTLQQKAKLIIRSTKESGRLLDMGAGVGAFLATMKKKGWKVTGLEPDAVARKNAKDYFDIALDEPAAMQDLPEESYNAVTMWHVLEHVHQLHSYIEALKAVLAKDGRLFIAVPNYTSGDADTYKNYWAAYDVPRHLYHFTPKSIEALVAQHGLKIVAKKPMWFDSFYISLLSSKYKKGSTSWLGAGVAGLRSNVKALFNNNKCSSLIYIIAKA